MSIETIAQNANTGISNSRSYLDNKANTLLKPKSAKGIAGFLFDIEDTATLTDDSDVTDYFTEDNSFINDHITDKPIVITLTGFIGELVFKKPDGVAGALSLINNRLETVEAYAGEFTPGAVQTAQKAIQKAQTAVSQINQTLDKAQNIIAAFDGQEPQPTLQEKALTQLRSLKKARELISVQTPWGFFDNMIMKTITPTQSGESKDITDISVTLKEFRTSEIKITNFDRDQFPPRVDIQNGVEEDQGIIRGTGRSSSFLFTGAQSAGIIP